ncbi:unnamed protein product [Clonostachys chloroleuca]|uniref:Ubiquitin-conjugating enzyme E2C-binding protein n=1 Tax=Clonostachys chloroleuca TaxID=1926264 RepID=A0AA35MGC2_9HYPO|nr:unnamed protein product [Clonostachys chloroleuca]
MNPSPESSAYIYAELLVNIRQVSVVANLPSPVDGSTKAVIDGHTIRLQHQSQSSTLVIPARVVAPPILPLPDPKQRTVKLSWRLPLSTAVAKPASLSLEGQALPWGSVDIQKESPIQCRGCHHEIVPRGTIKEWKDLPSENWAEMMEFWHCHKPHDHEKHDDEKLTQRGYGASNAIAAQPNVGFVDLTSFMVAESDCDGLLFSPSIKELGFQSSELALEADQSSKWQHISCKACQSEVGIYNVAASSLSLFKWQTLCQTEAPMPVPNSIHCLAATLTASISRTGSSKFVVLPHLLSQKNEDATGSPAKALHLWVLNPYVVYASSKLETKKTAMKILYQFLDVEQGNKLADDLNSDVQDISLPSLVVETAGHHLVSSSLLLPENDRTFREWHVGLLERWDSSLVDP